jgi:hypothetical protein
MIARSILAIVAACAIVLVTAAPALAHGVQGRAETPIPVAAFFWSAGIVLVVSFAALALGWRRPLLAHVAWRRAPRWLERVVLSPVLAWGLRLVVLAAFLLVLAAAAFGSTLLSRNIAPLVVFVVWWVGLVPCSCACPRSGTSARTRRGWAGGPRRRCCSCSAGSNSSPPHPPSHARSRH